MVSYFSGASRTHTRSVIVLALFALTIAPRMFAQTVSIPFITTYAGLAAGATPANTVCSTSLPVYSTTGTGAKYGDGCPATQASLSVPISVATDTQGDVFISDQSHQIIRVVYNGTGSDALATAIIAANVQNPGLIPVKGNIYTIAGGTTATPTTHYCNGAGTGPQGDDLELDGCPGAQTFEQLNRGVAVDADGNVFLSNGAVYPTIRVFYVGGSRAAALIQLADPSLTPQPGYVYKVAGYGGTTFRTPGSSCSGAAIDVLGDGCPAVQAYLNTPRGLFIDAAENIYFADQADNVIRRIDGTTSIITTIAGQCIGTTSCTATSTSGDGGPATGSSVNIYAPYAVTLDGYGNVFIAEGGSSSLPGRVRVVYAAGKLPGLTNPTPGYIYTYAGGAATSGTPAQMAAFQLVYGVSLDAAGFLYVTDYRSGSANSNHVWRVDPTSGNIIVFAGTGGSNLVASQHCDRVKQLGIITNNSLSDGCPATQAYLNTPQGGVAFDATGNGYIADRGDNVVRKLYYNNVFPATVVGSTSASLPQAFYFPTTTALLSKSATLQGTATTEFASTGNSNDNCPLGAALPAAPITCVSYVTFTPGAPGPRNAAYDLVDATGVVATAAITGTGLAPLFTINPGTPVNIGTNITASAVSTDLHGSAYVSDLKGKQVLRATIAGGPGAAIMTGLGSPRQTTVDNFGNLYVADALNNNVLKLPYGSATPIVIATGLNAPQGVVADALGGVYIADSGNNRLLYYSNATGLTTPVSAYPLTLSSPTALALDPSGNLYVVDTNHTRVVELPVGLAATVFTLPVGATPAAMAFDPAGDAYLADTASGSILFQPYGSATATALVSGLASPSGIAVGPGGNLFLADSTATSATAYNVSVNNSTLTTTNIPSSSLPVTLTLADVGNTSITLANPTYIETGASAAFLSSGTPTCTASLVLAPGKACTQSFVFTPTVAGTQSAKATFNTTVGQSVSANLTATATNLINTSLTIAPQNSTAPYGQASAYTVTLTPVTTGGANPTGTINFLVDGGSVASTAFTSGPYTFAFTASPTLGIHSVSASYTGDSVYGGSNTSTLLTVTKAATVVTTSYMEAASGTVLKAVVAPSSTGAIAFTGSVLMYVDNTLVATVPVSGSSPYGTVSATVVLPDGTHTYYATYTGDANYAGSTSTPVQTLTVARASTTTTLSVTATSNAGIGGFLLSAKVGSAVAGTPTGTVTFTNGSTVLAVVNLSTAINGVVTFLTSTTTYTNYTFTATYSGDGLYEPSASSGSDFVVITPLTTVAVPQGGQVSSATLIAPINGYTGSVTATCGGLPVNALCRFYPTPVVLKGTSTATLNVQLFSGVNPNVAGLSLRGHAPGSSGFVQETAMALLLCAPALLGVRRRRCFLRCVLILSALPALLIGAVGCGGKTPANVSGNFVTPSGSYAITLTVTDANGVAHSNILNATFTQ